MTKWYILLATGIVLTLIAVVRIAYWHTRPVITSSSTYTTPNGMVYYKIETYGVGGGCFAVKGAKGVNGGGDGGDAVICGDGTAIGGAGGDGSR